ncbi:right-handed parallel beta-helix repeat-containing protein [bacterium]|nr:right-handed parallel beta-helix repeat-containing protein [candidate division CSSED10-310 bacterium]
MKLRLLIVLLGVFLAGATHAGHYYVAEDGNDFGPGTEAQPWRHIQFALDTVQGSTSEPHYIHVAPGTYNEVLLMNEDDSYESLLGSGSASTIIDSQQNGRCLLIMGATGVEVCGFTMQNGYHGLPQSSSASLQVNGSGNEAHDCVVRWCYGLYQPGIFVTGPNEVHDCEVYGCTTDITNGNCGGIYVTYPDGALVRNNYIHDNECSGMYGAGGLTYFFTTATVKDNIIEGNHAVTGPGGVLLRYGYPTFTGNIVSGNSSDDGPALRIEDAQAIFENNLFAGNDTSSGVRVTGGCRLDEPYTFRLNTIIQDGIGISWSDCPAPDQGAVIDSCIIQATGAALSISNTDLALAYSCLSDDTYSGTGVMYDDPLFVDPAGGDYHLTSPGSPCIDAGDPELDFCTEPWPHGCRVNMGAYGNTMEAACSGVLTCTPTCPPTNTPMPTPWETASPGPSATPASTTPVPTNPPPSPTWPPSGECTLSLNLSDSFLSGGDRLLLELSISNGGAEIEFDQWICLEASGAYFFHPAWTEVPYATRKTMSGHSHMRELLLDVTLPEDLEPGGPYVFYGILVDAESGTLVTPLESAAFLFI